MRRNDEALERAQRPRADQQNLSTAAVHGSAPRLHFTRSCRHSQGRAYVRLKVSRISDEAETGRLLCERCFEYLALVLSLEQVRFQEAA